MHTRASLVPRTTFGDLMSFVSRAGFTLNPRYQAVDIKNAFSVSTMEEFPSHFAFLELKNASNSLHISSTARTKEKNN